MRRTFQIAILSVVSIAVIAFAFYLLKSQIASHTKPAVSQFRGEKAWEDVAYQLSLGPRIPGSEAHLKTVDWIESELQQAGWEVEIQSTESSGHPIKNIIGKWGTGSPWIILGAHYDSRIFADHDPDPNKHRQPVPGANDGASGVAVLLEIARVLPNANAISETSTNPSEGPGQVWVVFFDAEDNGRIADWDWIMGSRAFVDQLIGKPDAAVIVDMIGDSDLQIYFENNSDPELSRQIWDIGQELGYVQFISEPKYAILDDHIPFLEAGIPAADLIDFDYPYYHTTEDTADKVSPESLEAVGNTLIHWLARLAP
jgi:glutaminyl-peptide cyclotransferase